MRRRPLFLVAFFAVVAVVVTVLVAVLRNKPAQTNGQAVSGRVDISGYLGAKLSAHVYLPSGPGPHPLVVMPGSWGGTSELYGSVAKSFTDEGYVVVAYAQRGFGGSQGQIDLAGDLTQHDVSRVITWSINHEPVDPARVGALGASYGAGMSLLAAERDPRIKAVVAMSMWANLEQTYFPNGTPSKQAFASLYPVATVRRLSPEVARFHSAFLAGNYSVAQADLAAMSPSRSPITGVDALNRNGTAVMIVNDFQDSYFLPTPIVSFFDKLTGPRRLQLGPGDHGGQEFLGLRGRPSTTWDAARAWLDHYVRGVQNGVDKQPAVQAQDMTTGVVHSYDAWPSKTVSEYLGQAGSFAATPAMWTSAITGGVSTAADAPPFEIDVYPYRAAAISLPTVSRTAAAVWTGPTFRTPTLVSGSPSVHLTATFSGTQASLFAHLYDVDATGRAYLITFGTSTVTASGVAVDVGLEPIAWTVPPGHHLALVVDTADAKFATLTAPGQPVTFSSSETDPARLTLPAS